MTSSDLSNSITGASSPGNGAEGAICCPNCRQPMATRQVKLNYQAHPADIDVCLSCNLLWFDRSECISMTARSVLELFQFLGKSGKPQMPLSTDCACPRCQSLLVLSHDMTRSSRFTYWRCPSRHGELFTFCQFLLQKNFIRSPSADELAKLRKLVRQVACSQCGAPVDLMNDPVCSHCGSAITLIDPDGIAKAVQELNAREPAGASPGFIEAETRAALLMAQQKAIYEQSRRKDGHSDVEDLLDAGMNALKQLLDR